MHGRCPRTPLVNVADLRGSDYAINSSDIPVVVDTASRHRCGNAVPILQILRAVARMTRFNPTLAKVIAVAAPSLLILSGCSSAPAAAPTTAAPAAAPTTAAPAAAPTTAATAAPKAATGKIALLLPETKTTRYETADRPFFEAKFKQLAPGVDIIYTNANQAANTQLSQFEAALANGAKVVVLDPVDSKAAGAMADKAKAQGVSIIAYDRLILNSDGVSYYISFDNAKVGQLQAQ